MIDSITIGAEYDGIVRNIVDFGVFVQIAPGTDGLIHRSVIARDKQHRLSELLTIGGNLKVVVKSLDKDRGRIGLVAPELAGEQE